MKIMVIDGNSIFNRAFYGIRLLTNREGLYTNAIYGFLATFFKLREEENPDLSIVCFDRREKTFRHERFASYKAKRKGMPEEMAVQLPVLKEVLDAMGVVRCELAGFEADDLMGTISKQAAQHGDDCLLVTGDRDSLQLIGEHVTVRLVSSKKEQTIYKTYDTAAFQEEYGFDPIHLIDFKSLMGDASDNITGVPGIGEKTAMELLHTFTSLDDIYANLEDPRIKSGARTKLIEGEQAARDSYWLATIERDVPLPIAVQDLQESWMDEDKLRTLLEQLELKTFIKKLGLTETKEKTAAQMAATVKYSDIEAVFALLAEMQHAKAVTVVMPQSLQAVCLLENQQANWMTESDFAAEEWYEILRRIFSGSIPLVLHDGKELLVRLQEEGVTPQGIVFDTCIGAYVLNPAEGDYSLERVALSYLNQQILPEQYNEADAFSLLGISEDAVQAMVQHAQVIEALYVEIQPQIEEKGMHLLYYEIELPLMTVLADMQHIGCKVDADLLRDFGTQLDRRVAELTEQIYEAAGEVFNINSPKVLGTILFEKLGLPFGKKTKTGYSTSAEVLENLIGYHPIIGDVLQYRQFTKLKSTYVDGLLKVIHPKDGRIHSHFQQTVTATGRLSSTDPNLQNIPVRTELGRELRRMFTAQNQDMVLIDADYSQIELRILAHIAQDKNMIAAFQAGKDIHRATAAQIFHLPEEAVTSEMRASCKAVNFGIVYGISDFSLAQDIHVSRKEAGEYIAKYLDTYSGVRAYMENSKQQAREKGYVQTLFGRRRYIPDIHSKNFNVRAGAERIAMNTPIQGTAADIIKIAMVRVWKRLKAEHYQGKLILQIHDELIIEAPKAEQNAIIRLLREEMEGALQMEAPLVAEAKAGFDWYTAH